LRFTLKKHHYFYHHYGKNKVLETIFVLLFHSKFMHVSYLNSDVRTIFHIVIGASVCEYRMLLQMK